MEVTEAYQIEIGMVSDIGNCCVLYINIRIDIENLNVNSLDRMGNCSP